MRIEKFLLASFLSISLICSYSCSNDDDDKLKQEEQDKYAEYITPELENALINKLGATIHRGINPPDITGYYLMRLKCVKSSVSNDPYLYERFNDYYTKFYDKHELVISLDAYQYKDKVSSTYNGKGVFICGEGDKFSVFTSEDFTIEENNAYGTSLTIFSGTVKRNSEGKIVGITNFEMAYLMKENNGFSGVIPNGSGRIFIEIEDIVDVITKDEFENKKMSKAGLSLAVEENNLLFLGSL